MKRLSMIMVQSFFTGGLYEILFGSPERLRDISFIVLKCRFELICLFNKDLVILCLDR